MSAPVDRIKALDEIEKEVITCLQSAGKCFHLFLFAFVGLMKYYHLGQAFLELSKEKSSLKQVESHTHSFLKALGSVESKLTEQINYLTQVSTGNQPLTTAFKSH